MPLVCDYPVGTKSSSTIYTEPFNLLLHHNHTYRQKRVVRRWKPAGCQKMQICCNQTPLYCILI